MQQNQGVTYSDILFEEKRKTSNARFTKHLRLQTEARAGFEPAITMLQTGALPLGYRAILNSKMTPTGIEPVLPP